MPRVYVSAVIEAPAARVWGVVRDFNGLPQWLPPVAESRIEDGLPADRIGCVRAFTLRSRERFRERLLALSDYEYSVTYSILESPLPLSDYVATLRLFPITETDTTFAEWQAEFECPPDRAVSLQKQVGEGVFRAGLERLKLVMGR